MTAAEQYVIELHHLAFRAMTRLHGIATYAHRLQRRQTAGAREEAETILRTSERAALLTRRLWLAAEHRGPAAQKAAWRELLEGEK